MKRALLLTTAISGLILIGMSHEAQAQVTTTTTVTQSYDFPDSAPLSINTTKSVESNCPPQCGRRQDLVMISPDEYKCVTRCAGQCADSCFTYDVQVQMADGSTKKIGEIVAGDETAYGIVNQTYIRRFDQSRAVTRDFQLVYRGGLYEYRGILVTGNHIIKDYEQWLTVAGLPDARPVFAPHVENVYNLDVEGGIIPVVDSNGSIVPFLDDKQFLSAKHLAA